jgi:hypothetical protein
MKFVDMEEVHKLYWDSGNDTTLDIFEVVLQHSVKPMEIVTCIVIPEFM